VISPRSCSFSAAAQGGPVPGQVLPSWEGAASEGPRIPPSKGNPEPSGAAEGSGAGSVSPPATPRQSSERLLTRGQPEGKPAPPFYGAAEKESGQISALESKQRSCGRLEPGRPCPFPPANPMGAAPGAPLLGTGTAPPAEGRGWGQGWGTCGGCGRAPHSRGMGTGMGTGTGDPRGLRQSPAQPRDGDGDGDGDGGPVWAAVQTLTAEGWGRGWGQGRGTRGGCGRDPHRCVFPALLFAASRAPALAKQVLIFRTWV